MTKATQDNRLLSITTPLGKDYLLIKKLDIKEEISELFEIKAELLYDEEEDSDFQMTPIKINQILGQTVSISLIQPDGIERVFTGMVNRLSQIGRDREYTAYEATIVPHIWKLTQNSQSRIFQNKRVPDILKEVFDGYEIKLQVRGEYKPRNYCVQYQETDFDFASRLMEEEGIYYYFEHTNETLKMVLRDDFNKPENCPNKSEIPMYVEDLDADDHWESAIKTIQTNYTLQTGKITVWDYNFQLTKKTLDKEILSAIDVGGNQELEVYTFPSGYARKYDGIDKSGGEQPANLNDVFPDIDKTAKNRLAALDSQYKVLKGTSDCASLTPGYRFQLKNHPNKEINTQYIILSVEQTVDQIGSYRASIGRNAEKEESAYKNTFTCIPQGSGQPEFRPPLKTAKPIMHGSQTAIVVGPAGEEIFTDKYGRVKVHFHWDRTRKFNPDSSCWVRVAREIAGNKWGSMHIPRIGQEVIVDFIEGDPDQPIITGSVYNPETMPHYELPKYKTLTYFKTRTSPDDGKGFNELRFEDKAGKEQVFMRSQLRMDVRVRGSYYKTVGGNRQEVIGVRADNKPGGNLAVTVGGNYDLHVKDSMYIGIDGKLNEAVKDVVVEDYQSSLATLVKNKAELNAMEIIMEAKTKISFKVGGNCIVIDPTGITIAGTPTVKINSGGFGTETGDPTIDDPLDAETSDTGEPGYLDRPRSGSGSGRKRNSRQLKSQHYVAPPRKNEDPKITAMRGTLANSAQGRHALEVYDRYGVEPTFTPGKGSTYDPATNKTNLDPSEDPTTSALTFVHEMNHAEAANEKKSGDINNQSKNDYVNTMVNEETEGTVRSIEARNELAKSGTDVSGSHFPLENQYQQAHDKAVADAKAANPNISNEEAEAIGKKAGADRVKQGFNNGEVVTSNTKEKYPDYYGNDWNKAHPKKTP